MRREAPARKRESPTSRNRRIGSALGTDHRTVVALLLFLLTVDVLLISAHVTIKIIDVREFLLDLGVDRGYGEFWQYLKYLATALLLVAIAVSTRWAVAFAWIAVTVYLALDDALGLHEGAGARIAPFLPGLGSNGIHVGELIWLGTVGALLTVVVALAHRRTHARGRAVSVILGCLFGGLIVFGVVVDAIHHLLLRDDFFDAPLTALEDGSELLLMSLVVAFVWGVAVERHRPDLDFDPPGAERRRTLRRTSAVDVPAS